MIIDARWIWENFRPLHKATQLIEKLGGDPFEAVDMENKFYEQTVTALNAKDWATPVKKELERLIAFAQNRIDKDVDAYDNTNIPFQKRRHLLETRVPVATEYLNKWICYRDKVPIMFWEPNDVIELKRLGVEKFVRFNFERFYEYAKTTKQLASENEKERKNILKTYPLVAWANDKMKEAENNKTRIT